MTFTPDELNFYNRQMRLAEVGPSGQERLKNSSVLLVGLGGLGSPLALYLVAAGIGRIGIVEFDQVDSSNLHRQVLYDSSQIGKSKLKCGAERLRELNPHIKIEEHPFRFSASNARDLVRDYDLVADGADNFATRYLVNDACVLEGKPLVSASILAFEGQLSVFNHKGGPCYRCLYPEAPTAETVPSCAEAGVLGALPGVMGSLQACEVLKIVLGAGEPVSGRLLHFDALSLSFTDFKIHRSPDCAVCGASPTISDVFEQEALCEPGSPKGDSSNTSEISEISEIDPLALMNLLKQSPNEICLIDVREKFERDICRIDPSLHHPLGELISTSPSQLNLPADKTLVCYCKSGGRSLRAARHFAQMGRKRVLNLTGGISAWAEEVDRSMKRY